MIPVYRKIDPVTEEEGLPAPLEESSFATLFPKYREKYLREVNIICSITYAYIRIRIYAYIYMHLNCALPLPALAVDHQDS